MFENFDNDDIRKRYQRLVDERYIGEMSLEDCIDMANKGNEVAQTELGCRYRDGKGVEKDEEAAINWLQKAVDNGYINAMVELGRLYRKRTRYTATTQALELFKRAADAGDERGMAYVAEHYVNQPSRGQIELGYHYLKKAAEKGYEPAISFARQLHIAGSTQLVRDIVKPFPEKDVFVWYRNAAHSGDSLARKNYHSMLRSGHGTLEERIRVLGEPEYEPLCEKPVPALFAELKKNNSETIENIAYSLYSNLDRKPSLDNFEKLLLTDRHFKYGEKSKPVKDEYIRAINAGSYGSVIDKKDVETTEAILAKATPDKGITRNKWFVIAAVLLLPAILPAIWLKVSGDPLLAFGFIPVILIFLVVRARKPYSPRILALHEKQEAVDNFVKKYSSYVNNVHNAATFQRKALLAKGLSQDKVDEEYGYKYIVAYYQRLKDMLDRYRGMDFGVRNTPKPQPKAKPGKKSKPRSRI